MLLPPFRVALLFTIVIVCTITANRALAEVSMQPISSVDHVPQYQMCQWAVDAGQHYKNPFDPREVAIDATFTGPSNDTIKVPGFWDGSRFIVRFSPPVVGQWRAKVTIKDSTGSRETSGGPFSVVPSRMPGFVRRAANNRYCQFDDGKSFFMVGLNLCWAKGPAVPWFNKHFGILHNNGGNYARVWMCNSDLQLENKQLGLNIYDMHNAKVLDDVLADAQKDGIYLMLTFMNHREFIDHDMWGKADWPNLPYNAANGGPATQPIDFFTNPQAKQLFKDRLRYIVARYSAYRSVGFWEFFNEQEYTQFPVPNSWNAEMAEYLRQVDPVKHMITTSANVPAEVWHEPQIDLTQTHIYGDGTASNLVAAIAKSERKFENYDKPHLIGEMGLDYHGPDSKLDPEGKGTALHNSLWGALATGNAGTAIYWWWDNYIEPKNLWHVFKPIGEFSRTIDWAHRNYRPINIDELYHGNAKGPATDLVIMPSGGWGDTTRQTVMVPPNGRPHVTPACYLYGPKHKDITEPLTFDLTLPQDCELKLMTTQVSDFAVIRVSVDDKPVRDLFFDALPGASGISDSKYNEKDKIYTAIVEQPSIVPLPAGHHRVTLQVVGGDWIEISKIIFTHALDSKYANLISYAVQDSTSKDTVLWLWDTRSNWQNDQSETSPPKDSDVKLMVPNIPTGKYDCEWIDTRSGQTISHDTISAGSSGLSLAAPPFTRDVALRVRAAH